MNAASNILTSTLHVKTCSSAVSPNFGTNISALKEQLTLNWKNQVL